ncbi:MAG: hypothetical protein RI890_372, partial [Actinomycetota bacterium]
MIIPFKHQLQAHCESGVTSNLLKHYGLPISEPLAFGIGSGLFFAIELHEDSPVNAYDVSIYLMKRGILTRVL